MKQPTVPPPTGEVESELKRALDDISRSTPQVTLAGFALTGSVMLLVIVLAAWFGVDTLNTGAAVMLASIVVAIYASAAMLHVWYATHKRMAGLQRALSAVQNSRSQAEAANRAKSRFLAAMSHEIRTPMNGVLGMNALLLDTELTAEQRNYASAVDASGRALLSIIDEILDATKIESGAVDLVVAPFSVTETVESITELLAPRAHAKDIAIACYIDPVLADVRLGDANRLRQILLNLAGNAIKFTDRGGVTIRVDPDAGDNCIAFSVIDTGIGIDPADQQRIFEAYAQTAEGAERKYGGTGLGLAISLRLATRLGGSLSLHSQPGQGSRFVARLPFKPDPAAPDAPADKPLQGRTVHLAVKPSPPRDVLVDYIVAFGGQVEDVPDAAALCALLARKVVPDNVPDIVCSTDYADQLDDWRRSQPAAIGSSHVWLLAKPEDRRRFGELMGGPLTGYLLTPLRRRTLLDRLVNRDDLRLHRAASDLRRTAARQAPAQQREAREILLVEDNQINARLATKVLERAGYEVTWATSGHGALDIFRQAVDRERPRPCVVLMDLLMPGWDGLETTRRIRALEAERHLAPVPILALSANARPEDHRAALDAGMNGHMSKPFEREDLESALERLINGAAAAASTGTAQAG